MLIVLPLFAFGLLEAVLHISGYGVTARPLVESGIPGFVSNNVDYHRLYYPETSRTDRPLAQQYRPTLVRNSKPDDVFRIVVLGGSAAKGFPHLDQHSFSSFAGALLTYRMENLRAEVINLSQSAMSSYYVRDTARRIWKHDPDLVVVYSGHNEYYGTIGQASSTGHLSKLLFMRMKGFRTFQLLFNLFAPPSQSSDGQPATLMASRLEEGRFPPDDTTDATVAERYVRNLQAVHRMAARRDVPLVVIDPVSNVISMPPFASKSDDNLQPYITNTWQQVVEIEDAENLNELADQLAEHDYSETNAHVLFMQAAARAQAKNFQMSLFTQARDADALPFRAREPLRQALEDWALQHTDSVTYVPLQDALLQVGGQQALGDHYFIDHVHFNTQGNMLVGRVLADAIISATEDVLHIRGESWPPADRFTAQLQLLPMFELTAAYKIQALMDNPPFRDMLIPYAASSAISSTRNTLMIIPEDLRSDLLQAHYSDIQQIIGEYLNTHGRIDEYIQFLTAQVFVNPGNYNTHYNLAILFDALEVHQPQVLQSYQRAYLLSQRRNEVRIAMEGYAVSAGLESQLDAFYEQID